ncbi:MAG: hypothetical protein ABFD49_06065 [Armatimonadota bacterium]|nr:hypothetical protein [bacterium]
MDEQEHEKDVGQKGGASEAYMGAHHYYEPTATAVTDIVVPATRIQWGPTFAGLIIAMSVTFLWTALGIALGVGVRGLGYWIVGFGSLGLFLGSLMAARTARADVVPAILHAVVIWSLVVIGHVLAFGGMSGTILASAMNVEATRAGVMPITEAFRTGAWWFFGGFLILLVASILGGLAGINPPTHEEAGAQH